jgi:hypothetical protein
MPEEKVDWRIEIANAAQEIKKKASELIEFLSLFFESKAAKLSKVRPTALIVETVIEELNKVKNKAEIILQEILQEEVDWEKIKEAFPTRGWLGSIEKTLAHLDKNPTFRGIMPFYTGSLQEDFAKNIEVKFQYMLDIFFLKLGRREFSDRYEKELTPTPQPPTEEELEREYEEATGKKTPQIGDLPPLFENISQILTREFGEREGFSTYWEGVTKQFRSALRTADIDELRDIYRQIVKIYESLPEDKQKIYANVFNQFFTAVRDYALPLLKFKLIRHLLGLE